MKEKALSEKDMIKRLVKNYTELKREYDKLRKGYAERVKKLKEEYRLHGFKTKEFFEVIDKIMGNFNHSPQDTKLNSGDSSFKSQPEDNNIKGCGKTFKQKSNLSEYTARCGQLICPEVELCPKCQVNKEIDVEVKQDSQLKSEEKGR